MPAYRKKKGQLRAAKKVTSACRKLVLGRVKLTPDKLRLLKRHQRLVLWLASCNKTTKGQKRAHQLIQRGGLFPLIPLLAAAAPFIGKALLGIGASAAGAAIGKAINKH